MHKHKNSVTVKHKALASVIPCQTFVGVSNNRKTPGIVKHLPCFITQHMDDNTYG